MTDFDAAAKTWDQDSIKVDRARAIAAAILNRVPIDSNTQALEYGAGTGLLGFALQPHVGHMVLADASVGMLAVAREKISASAVENVSTLALDLEKEPAPERRFDLLMMSMTLHHIADTRAILDKFHTLLQDGGYLCIVDLDKEDGSFHGTGFHGHHGFDRGQLAALAESAGFINIYFDTVFHMQRRAGDALRTFPLFLMTAQRKPAFHRGDAS